jgi:hypothetical protein
MALKYIETQYNVFLLTYQILNNNAYLFGHK